MALPLPKSVPPLSRALPLPEPLFASKWILPSLSRHFVNFPFLFLTQCASIPALAEDDDDDDDVDEDDDDHDDGDDSEAGVILTQETRMMAIILTVLR